MRSQLLLLPIALAAAALGLGLFLQSDQESAPSGLRPEQALTPKAQQASIPPETQSSAVLAALPAPRAQSPTASGPQALEGQVLDRFGQPAAGERVWLLAPGQPHPAADADHGDYVTAKTNDEGRFSLGLAGTGPWSLGVGPRGASLLPPSEAKTLDGLSSARVVVPGRTLLRVDTQRLANLDQDISFEVEILQDPKESSEAPADDDRRRPERSTNRASGRPASQSPFEKRGRTRNRGQRDQKNGMLLDAPAPTVALASWSQDGKRSGRTRRDKSQRNNKQDESKGRKSQDDATPQPPAERWKRKARLRLDSDAEGQDGMLVVTGLEPGSVARLVLRSGKQRYEGGTRFPLVRDAHTQVTLLAFQPATETFTYSARTFALDRQAASPGIHWED